MLRAGSAGAPGGSLIRNVLRVAKRFSAIINTPRMASQHNQLHMSVQAAPTPSVGIRGESTAAPALSTASPASSNFSTESSTRRENGKEKVVILGSGWAGYEVAMHLDPKLFDVTLVSPANHKVFTPMLPSSATGYMDFQSISNPVRTLKGVRYQQAKARNIDFDARVVTCSDVFKNHEFAVHYDRLVVAVGCKTNTFNTPGVAEREGDYVFFLKHLRHAAMIKNRIIECFERADIPGVSDAEKQRLLSFVVVGGGPTSCEFAADLHDFVQNDISKVYSDLMPHFSLSVVEASDHILGSFDIALQSYALDLLTKRKINLRLKNAVTEVVVESREDQLKNGHHSPFVTARLSSGDSLPVGCMVWSAGLAPVKLIEALDSLERHPNGRLKIDERLQVRGHEGRVWAIGDCAMSSLKGLPPIAPAALQQGAFIADFFNAAAKSRDNRNPSDHAKGEFELFGMGSMANLGIGQGIYDASSADPKLRKFFETISGGSTVISGPLAWLMWKGGYWILRQVQWRNRVLIPMQWFKTWVFGRDMTRFF